MRLSPILIFHICSAITGFLSGVAALFFRKGSPRHRAAGNVFVISMLAMSATGAYMAFVKPELVSVVVGVLTFYLVATAWLAVRRKAGETGVLEFALLLIASADGAAGVILGWQAAHGAASSHGGFPGDYFVFGAVALFCAALDVRMFIRGGVFGAHRIVRHLWRMCSALLITAVSFFLGTPSRFFPEVIRRTHLLNMPIVVIAVLTVFWLFRVRDGAATRNLRKQT